MKRLSPDQKHRMHQGTLVILSSLLIAILAVIAIITFPSFYAVLCWGYC